MRVVNRFRDHRAGKIHEHRPEVAMNLVLTTLLILSTTFAQGDTAMGQTDTRKPEEKVMQSTPYDGGSSEPFLGDKPGDVVRVKSTDSGGLPVTLPDGRMMLWGTAKPGENYVATAVFSSDNGITWSEPKTLFEFPNREKAAWSNGASLVDDKGYVHLFGLEYYQFCDKGLKDRSIAKSPLWHARSRDGGKTWDPVQNVPFGFGYTGSSNGAFQSKTGRIFAPLSALSDREIGPWLSLCPYSDDNGATWRMPKNGVSTNTGARDWYEGGAVEPVGIQLNDGRLWLLPRSQDGFQWESYSKHNGITWSPAQHTRFVSNQSAMAIRRLKDGRLILFWNNCGAEGLLPIKWGNAERAVLAVAISDDEGKTWKGYREVARVDSNTSVGYPYVAQMPNGKMLVFASGYLGIVDPQFITSDSLSENFEQGVRRWSTLSSEGVSAVDDPDGGPGKVLKMVKPKAEVTSAACMNFPFGRRGAITMKLRIEPKFQGAHITLSDHYDLPGLPRDASFPIQINAKGRIMLNGSGGSWLSTPGDLTPGRWHDLKLTWDCTQHEALMELDGIEIGRLHQFVCTDGVCYLRIRSMAPTTDEAGMYIKSVDVRSGQ